MTKATALRDTRAELPPPPAPSADRAASGEIDLERVVYDPEYRRWARDYLNGRRDRPHRRNPGDA